MVWDFKRQEDNSWGSEKNSCLVNKCLLGHLEIMGHRGDLDGKGPPRFLPVYHTLFTLDHVRVLGADRLSGIL